jgi:hypothetical protein
MAQLGFQEIAQLINYSKSTEIELSPALRGRGWSLYRGRHRIHASAFEFKVLYLYSDATQQDLLIAERHLDDEHSTHVVGPASLVGKHFGKHTRFINDRNLFERAKGLWTTKEYLLSYVNDEIERYLTRLRGLVPKYYIDPRVETPSGFPRRIPNPVLSFLRGTRFDSGLSGGALGILLAEPGQGKTYMSRHLVSQIAESDKTVVPVLVDSSQWHSMSTDDLSLLAKTIAHSFRHFDATIGWLEGHEEEFLRTTLSEDIFRIVFDGFDEYILRNRGSVQTIEVLESLAALAKANQTRIVITSRTDFWNTNLPAEELQRFIEATGSLVFTILPFDLAYSRNYFNQRLQDGKSVDRAVQTYSALQKANKDFVGRGFVLSLIADLLEVEGWKDAPRMHKQDALMWLMEALCEREVLRHQLPFTAHEQISIMRTFAIEVARGAPPNSEFLELAMHDVRPQLDTSSRRETLEKFAIHPLLKRDEAQDQWRFKQEQIGVVLLADQIVSWPNQQVADFMKKAELDAGARQDLSTAILDLLSVQLGQDEQAFTHLGNIIGAMSNVGDVHEDTLIRLSDGPRLAAVLSLIAVERFLPKGRSHDERTALLLRLTGGTSVRWLSFTGTIARYDFRGVRFERCRFERVTWANCQFDGSTLFRYCQFVGGNTPLHCEGLGSVNVESTCRLDPEAYALFSSVKVKEGHKLYSEDDLRSDIAAVLSKFIIKGGIGIRSVDALNVGKGAISASRYKDEILDALRSTVLEQHHIAGRNKGGYNIREEAKEAIKFYATNNVFTGSLREAFEALRKKLLRD